MIISGATSPAPRAIARIRPVITPGRARGSTIRQMVCHLLAPQPYEPSRIELGTAASASSVATMTTGTVSSASVNDAHTRPPVPKVGDGSRSGKKIESMVPPIT